MWHTMLDLQMPNHNNYWEMWITLAGTRATDIPNIENKEDVKGEGEIGFKKINNDFITSWPSIKRYLIFQDKLSRKWTKLDMTLSIQW